MTEPYDTKTMRAIIEEARRQGYDDSTIAVHLGLPNDYYIFKSPPLGCELSGIGEGLRARELDHLHEDDKQKILIITSRIGESDFRRGLYQGFWAASTGQKYRIHPEKLRWGGYSLDDARMFLCGTKMTSLERLKCEHDGILRALGFDMINDPLQ